MSDFTKEELQMLLGGISLYLEEIAFMEKEGDPYDLLFRKSKSMLDNYCDHEWLCWDDEHNTRECTKCHEKCIGEV